MSKVAVVFHSGYGHTVKQAEAIAKGVVWSAMEEQGVRWVHQLSHNER